MVDVFVSDRAGTFHQIDVLKWTHTTYRDFQKNEKFEFEADYYIGIAPRSFIRVEDNGEVIFRGAVGYPTGTVPGRPLKWDCLSIPELLKRRFSWAMRWGAPNVVSGYVALTIEQVLGSHVPSQAAGIDQYIPPLLWMAQSYLSVSPDSITSGVWYFPGWGTGSRAGTKDVYVGGHLCTEVDALGDVDAATYRIYRNSSDLYVYGAGVGDYGPVCISNAFDYGIRWGDVAKDTDYLLAAFDVGIENYWQALEDFLFSNGVHLFLRHTKNYTYIDGDLNAYERGSTDYPAFDLYPGDWVKVERSTPQDIPPSALIGLGAGEGVTKIRYTRCDPADRGAWIEQLSEHTEGQVWPKGRMDDKVDVEWGDVSALDYLNVTTSKNLYRPGDWLQIHIAPGEEPTAQIFEINRDETGLLRLKLGGKYASLDYAFIEKQESLAVQNMIMGQQFGSQEASDTLGPAATFTLAFTPTAAADRDTADIRFSLWATTPEDCDEPGLSVTYTVEITNTTYPGGQVIAILRNMPWGTDPVFEDLPIAEWCALDGTEETLDVTVTDPSGNLTTALGYTGRVTGIGRYGQTPIATLTKQSVVSSTLSADIPYSKLDISYYAGSGSGTGLYAMTNEAAPDYDFKIVLRTGIGIMGPSSGITSTVRPYIKTHSVVYYGDTQSVTSTWKIFEDDWTTNPYSGAAWSQAEVDDVQCGLVISASWGDNPCVGCYRGVWANQVIELR